MPTWFPIEGAALSLDFANTTYYRRGRVVDGLATSAGLADWLTQVSPRLGTIVPVVDSRLHRDALALRDSVRSALAALGRGAPLPIAAVTGINRASAQAPFWRGLHLPSEGRPTATSQSTAPPGRAVLAQLATDLVDLATTSAEYVHSCPAPRCLGYFRQDDPRRVYCSPHCATRVRVARHHRRHHDG